VLINGKRVILRAIELSDSELLREMVNSASLEQYENGFSFPVSVNAQDKWMKEHLSGDTESRLIIELDGDPVGYMSIVNVDWKNKSCHTGIKLFSEKNMGQGIGTDSVMAVMRFCFEQMHMNRIESCFLDFNTRSRALFVEKCRWAIEGQKRQAVFKNGQYHDLVLIGILREEYDDLICERDYWKE